MNGDGVRLLVENYFDDSWWDCITKHYYKEKENGKAQLKDYQKET